jgi:UDP-N-acetylmuramoyl-L-alanyl-D-glutamate--2,6-diaminopimelate ligase
MASVAEKGADRLVLTSDNPRSESPQAILAAMQQGLVKADRAQVLEDRAMAIAWAIEQADCNDVVLVAGKGHEDYQEVQGVRHAFSDPEHVQAALQRRAARLCRLAQGAQA